VLGADPRAYRSDKSPNATSPDIGESHLDRDWTVIGLRALAGFLNKYREDIETAREFEVRRDPAAQSALEAGMGKTHNLLVVLAETAGFSLRRDDVVAGFRTPVETVYWAMRYAQGTYDDTLDWSAGDPERIAEFVSEVWNTDIEILNVVAPDWVMALMDIMVPEGLEVGPFAVLKSRRDIARAFADRIGVDMSFAAVVAHLEGKVAKGIR